MATTAHSNPFGAAAVLDTPLGKRTIHRLDALGPQVHKLPISIKVLLEAALRRCDGYIVTEDHVKALASYNPRKVAEVEIPFTPGRVVLQDFTGVPCVVDLAAMRDAMKRLGGDPRKVNPLVPCDLVIDHSVQVDAFGSAQALTINSRHEFERNTERYQFLKWGQQALANFRVVPPATGIVHQVNLEYLAKVVWDAHGALYPDSLVGTDSHTTMINGLGVVGWGVGGIEAEAVMLGQPIYMLIPEVVGFRLTGELPGGVTATDVVLTVTQMLRRHGVVNKFVEFFGPGLDHMPLANRATIANMAPEYGATIGFFPVDERTLDYLRLSGRDEKLLATVEQYCKTQGLWRPRKDQEVVYSSTLELDLSTVEPSLAGPKRPQDRVSLAGMKAQWHKEMATALTSTASAAGGVAVVQAPPVARVTIEGKTCELTHGSVVIAAITSCTNTSNPEVMVAAGLLARKARQRGLTRKPWVKTSLAPGSTVVTAYYEKSKLNEDLDALGFNLVGYGCTTCIGNSGPLPPEVSRAIHEHGLVVASVLSGNRNFEGRVNPEVKANYLASPPLVVAYAIAGTVDIDLTTEPLGTDQQGRAVYLKDLWPTPREVQDVIASCISREQFVSQYARVFDGSQEWRAIAAPAGELYQWDDKSTYIQNPPFFTGLSPTPAPIKPISGARCLVKVGDSVTTDHISPAGSIKKDSPAGKYLIEQGVPVSMFNSYGSRRGNDRVMTRGTFANIRVRNQLAPGTEGGFTTFFGGTEHVKPETRNPKPEIKPGQVATIYDASVAYRQLGVPLVILAGKDYGMGSSRDWAAKGVFLLGVRVVIAESFERIHRSNLVGMGVLPLCYKSGQTAASLGLDGSEMFDIAIDDAVKPRQDIVVTARKPAGSTPSGQPIVFTTVCRIDTPVEVEYYRHGGILQTVLRKMARS